MICNLTLVTSVYVNLYARFHFHKATQLADVQSQTYIMATTDWSQFTIWSMDSPLQEYTLDGSGSLIPVVWMHAAYNYIFSSEVVQHQAL